MSLQGLGRSNGQIVSTHRESGRQPHTTVQPATMMHGMSELIALELLLSAPLSDWAEACGQCCACVCSFEALATAPGCAEVHLSQIPFPLRRFPIRFPDAEFKKMARRWHPDKVTGAPLMVEI